MPKSYEDLSVKEFLEAYQGGRRSFENICLDAEDQTITGMHLDGLRVFSSLFYVRLLSCSLQNSSFESSNIKQLYFEKCDLTGARMSECLVECLELVDCNLTNISLGKNHAYGNTFEGSKLIEIFAKENRLQ
jgi:uncharacterized protein YjbI with pentapeptide repeats